MDNVKTCKFGDKITPRQALIDALDKSDTMKYVVVVSVDEDDYINTNWSSEKMLVRVGMMQVAIERMIKLSEDK